MIERIINHMEEAGVRYCILHSWHSLPEYLPSDLDIVVAPQDLSILEKCLCDVSNAQLVQMIQYEDSCYVFILAFKRNSEVSFIPVDTALDYRGDGPIFLGAAELLADRQRWKGFWVAAPRAEFAYLLGKKVFKGAMPDHQKVRLQYLYESLGDKATSITERLFGPRLGAQVIRWLTKSDWESFEAQLSTLKRALHWQVVKHDPFSPLRFWFPELRRLWRRWRYPAGLFVVLLGSDGAGKSTLIQRLKTTLVRACMRTEVTHLRSSLFRRKTDSHPVTDPHGKSPYPWWLSVCKVFYYFLDFSLGYLCVVRPRLVRATLELFDRYYHDLLIDPRRYRYGGPQWLPQLIRRFIPSPNLFFVLDVPVEQLLARKREVSREELERQREAYRQLAAELPNAVFLDGSLPAEQVADTAATLVLDYMQERYFKRRHVWFSEQRSETLSWLSSVFSSNLEKVYFVLSNRTPTNSKTRWQLEHLFGWLSLKDGRGYLIPMQSRLAAAKALEIYNAQSLKARLTRRALELGLKLGITQFLLRRVSIVVRSDVSKNELSETLLFEHLKKVLGRQDLCFAVSLGTPGLHRKPVLQVLIPDGKTIAFVKIGWNEVTNALVRNEAKTLEQLATSSAQSFAVPRLLYTGCWNGLQVCIQSAPEGNVTAAPQEITTPYLDVIKELAGFHTQWQPLKKNMFWEDLLTRIDAISHPYYHSVLDKGVRVAREWLGDKTVPVHFCHGDFTPWNVKQVNRQLYLFDWESANWEASLGWDLFHFFVLTQWRLGMQTPSKIYKTVLKTITTNQEIRRYLKQLNLEKSDLRTFFLLYLLDRLASCASEEKDFQKLQTLAMLINLCLHEEML